jgi:4-hydroxybenzoate polyprenyltransferase
MRSLLTRRLFLFMRMLFSLYRYVNLLSLDVVAGSVCCALFFGKAYGTALDANTLVVLGLTVWLIYTADHLLDASKIRDNAVTKRHSFHQKHNLTLLIVSLIVLIVDFVLTVSLPGEILSRGIIALVFVALYLIFHSHFTFFKEAISAVLYCTGIFITVMPSTFNTLHMLLFLQFFLVVAMNLILFAWFEVDYDVKQKSQSLATSLGKRKTGIIIWILFILNTLIWCCSFANLESSVLWMMALLHIGVFIASSFFARDERYRLTGDAIFLLPLVYLFP